MERQGIRLTKPALRRLRAKIRECSDGQLATRYRIVVLSAEGWSRSRIADATGWHVSTISDVRARWRREGEAGLLDGRSENGPRKVDERYERTLMKMVHDRSTAWGHRRPTWTLRLLISTMRRLTGVAISPVDDEPPARQARDQSRGWPRPRRPARGRPGRAG